MDSRMTLQIAQERIADLHRSADAQHRVTDVVEAPKPAPVIALRMAGADEAKDLRRLAGLDSERPLRGNAMVALVDGRMVAAISLLDGRVVADPMVATADARALLRQRADQLTLGTSPRRRRFRLRFA
jgi:hypothetical protein